jgi:2-hydroxy-3-keto-5-methylthiopentenyl-1-phosphate phosphatase
VLSTELGSNAFDSHFGHDKSREIRPYANLPDAERPTLFYAGDGVSDLSAAKETDLLFAKKGHGKRSSPRGVKTS